MVASRKIKEHPMVDPDLRDKVRKAICDGSDTDVFGLYDRCKHGYNLHKSYNPCPTCFPNASKKQIGGDHYKDMVIQPSEFIYRNGLNWLAGNAIKYICRYGRKHGSQDIDKAIHYLELLKEWEYASK